MNEKISCLFVASLMALAACSKRTSAVAPEPSAAASSQASAAPPAVDAGGVGRATLPRWPAASQEDLARLRREQRGQASVSAMDEGRGIDAIPPSVRAKLEALASQYAKTFTFMSAGRWTGQQGEVVELRMYPDDVSKAAQCGLGECCYSIIAYAETWDENPIHTFENRREHWSANTQEIELKKHGSRTVDSEQLRRFLYMSDNERAIYKRMGAGISSFSILQVGSSVGMGSKAFADAEATAVSRDRVAMLGDDEHPMCHEIGRISRNKTYWLYLDKAIASASIGDGDGTITVAKSDGDKGLERLKRWGRGDYMILSKLGNSGSPSH